MTRFRVRACPERAPAFDGLSDFNLTIMQQDTCVFDATRPVAVQLRGPDGLKIVRTRFPSDDEWAERQRRRKVIVKQLGRGMSETSIPNGEEIDAALLTLIRTEEEPAVDEFEDRRSLTSWRPATWTMWRWRATRSA